MNSKDAKELVADPYVAMAVPVGSKYKMDPSLMGTIKNATTSTTTTPTVPASASDPSKGGGESQPQPNGTTTMSFHVTLTEHDEAAVQQVS